MKKSQSRYINQKCFQYLSKLSEIIYEPFLTYFRCEGAQVIWLLTGGYNLAKNNHAKVKRRWSTSAMCKKRIKWFYQQLNITVVPSLCPDAARSTIKSHHPGIEMRWSNFHLLKQHMSGVIQRDMPKPKQCACQPLPAWKPYFSRNLVSLLP